MNKILVSLGVIGIATAGFWCASAYLDGIENAPILSKTAKRFSVDSAQIAQIAEIKIPFTASKNNYVGNFLSARFAQNEQRWDDAEKFISNIKGSQALAPIIVKQSMLLELNSGKLDKAAQAAEQVINMREEDEITRTLAALIIIAQHFKKQDYEQAQTFIRALPQSQLSIFIEPLLKSWMEATKGRYEIRNLQSNLLYVTHALYLADYLGEPDKAKKLLDELCKLEDLSIGNIEHFADIYAYLGEYTKAQELYESILSYTLQTNQIKTKINTMNRLINGEKFTPPAYYQPIKTPSEGLVRVYYDMAYILYRDMADDSARIFALLALAINPQHDLSNIMLASIALRQGYYDQAVRHYEKIQPSSPYYSRTRKEAATAYEASGDIKRAIATLEAAYTQEKDIEALVQIGEIYRKQSDFETALKHYNRAAKAAGDPIPAEHWYLLYARGMAYEQNGDWDRAEKDLVAAVEYQPNHPYILNYLGYVWAEKGVNLDKALELIDKALSLYPDDGHITDSLGWVYFQLGEYQEAVPFLERAVELLPGDPVVNEHLGDAYWKVGRRIEARYQWQRAQKYAKDDSLKETLAGKIENGLPKIEKKKHKNNGAILPSLRAEQESAAH